MIEPDNGRVVVLGHMALSNPCDLAAYIRSDEDAAADGFNERRWYRIGGNSWEEPPATFAGLLDWARQRHTQIALMAAVDVEAP
ncbi:hypothetical protein ABT369_39455 [Dactylosporangium sp. NPDC000244]|uniref:hypothetical protein n=1 Tax=Dactylosporangium sp. NPDC000244 TaxID=3154365 RepID=UPI00331B0313